MKILKYVIQEWGFTYKTHNISAGLLKLEPSKSSETGLIFYGQICIYNICIICALFLNINKNVKRENH